MSYLVIARKWRPQISTILPARSILPTRCKTPSAPNRIAHAYLFTGVRGVGKTTAARILAKALIARRVRPPRHATNAASAKRSPKGASIDVLEIDGASNRGIDEIRQIIDNVRYQPAQSRFKIYIIDEVHQVTKDAFNALLKTLEEPPPSVKFILATTEPHRLPATILSRCQRYDFRRINLREIVAAPGRDRQKRRARALPKARWCCWRGRLTAACATRSRCSSRFWLWRRPPAARERKFRPMKRCCRRFSAWPSARCFMRFRRRCFDGEAQNVSRWSPKWLARDVM